MRSQAATILTLLLVLCGTGTVAAESKIHSSHAIAMHGEPKYDADFTHFEYCNPDAPQGGTIRLAIEGTFDSFNPYIVKGNAGPGGIAETLAVNGADEPFSMYGLLAETIEWPDDRSWVIFRLRPEARWQDGVPVTADDVIFSLETLKTKGHPQYRFYYASIERAEKLDERSVKFVFAESENRELPLIAGQLPVLPKHYWEGRDFAASTLEPPLTSGPYRVATFEPGRFVLQERVKDYWGDHLAVNRGQNNFQFIRSDYFRDATAIRQALKAGEIDYRYENYSKAWATEYDVPQVRDGRLVKEEIKHSRPTGMQAFVMNMRRPLFQDPRVRRAIGYAFDFEWTNKTLFFGQYTRTESYFSNSELAATGLPEGEELEILERYRGRIPDEVFTTEYYAPETDGSGWPRENLAKAFALLEDAGWVVRDMKLVNAETGEPFTFEFLLVSQNFERIVLPFARNLKRLGIDARVRLVDQSQYINRVRSRDFDVVSLVWGQSDSPGNEQRYFWGSEAADSAGSQNYHGVKDPIIDELIEFVIAAPSRESLVARTRALDRVLLWHHFVVPAWHSRTDNILYWNKFSRPEITPLHGTSIDYWWYDKAKAAALEVGPPIDDEVDETPGFGWMLLVLAGLGLFGWIVFGRAMRRNGGTS